MPLLQEPLLKERIVEIECRLLPEERSKIDFIEKGIDTCISHKAFAPVGITSLSTKGEFCQCR
ncbi:hypothetical protein MUP77_24180 [Candidatus Bathyarchaeota archaeon]|nr:hypothetical protein [Candidatus Bathyarchaeota archaeon]